MGRLIVVPSLYPTTEYSTVRKEHYYGFCHQS
nr:MAG TPA: hypothetical protein [Bacteriophage sp.]